MVRNLLLLAVLSGICFACQHKSSGSNPLSGRWTSKWHNTLDFKIHFKDNNTFEVKVTGSVQDEEIFGGYKIMQDTLVIWDDLERPLVLCNYTDTGYYTFTKRESSMFFKVIRDACERRKLTLELGFDAIKKEG